MITALLAVAHAAGPLPLAVGNTWTYTVSERRGGGTRVLLFFGEPATTRKLADWTLSIDGRQGDVFTARLQRVPVEGLPSSTDLKLVERDGVVYLDAGTGVLPAIEMLVPPGAVSSERVRCVAHVLGGVIGTCAPLSGGPLGAPPGLLSGTVSNSAPGAIGQFLVGLATAGMIIPGSGRRSEYTSLVAFEPGPEQPPLEADPGAFVQGMRSWSSNRLRTGLAKRPSVEEVAAVMVVVPVGNLDQALAIALPTLAEADRHPVLRTALGRSAQPLRTLARARPQLERDVPEEHRRALLAVVQGDRKTAEALLEPDQDLLVAVYADASGSTDRDLLAAVRAQAPKHPTTVEGMLRIAEALTFDKARLELFELLVPRLPDVDRPTVVQRFLPAMGFDDSRKTLVLRHLKSVRVDQVVPLLSAFGFDAGRLGVLEHLLTVVDPADRGDAFVLGVSTLGFDSARLTAFRTHAELVASLPVADRRALLGHVTFAEDEARPLLGL